MELQAGCLTDALLNEYLGRTLNDPDLMEVERHAARCPGCRGRLLELFEFNRERAISSPTPEDVVERVLAPLRAEPVPRNDRETLTSRRLPIGGFLIALILLIAVVIFLWDYLLPG